HRVAPASLDLVRRQSADERRSANILGAPKEGDVGSENLEALQRAKAERHTGAAQTVKVDDGARGARSDFGGRAGGPILDGLRLVSRIPRGLAQAVSAIGG